MMTTESYIEHHEETQEEGIRLRILVDEAAKVPVLTFFATAIFWLLVGTALAIISSFKLHSPDLMGTEGWLTFGRVRPAHLDTVIYGWSSAGSIAVALWLMSRLCRAPIRHPKLLLVAAVLWNIGNALGLIGILAGYSTSVEWLEYPPSACLFLIAAFGIIMFESVNMILRRQPGHVYVSQWYIIAGIFWFPWLFATAEVLLFWFPIATPAQPAVNWWYAHNVLGLWFTPIGLASAYYFIPKVIGKPIHSYYLSMVGFWSLAFFYAWNGMHHLIGGPFPAWLISISVVASVMMVVPVLTVAVNHHLTMRGSFGALKWSPTLRFVVFGAMSYTAVSLQGSSMALPFMNRYTHFTHYTIAHAHLGMYAFVTMTLFGSIYYIVPRLTQREWPSAFLIKAHFWLCAVGVLLYWFALSLGGIQQGLELLNPEIPFLQVVKDTIPYLETRSFAGIMMTAGHVIFAFSFAMVLLGKTPSSGRPTLIGARD
jgi:cytochrome c oxidase cbb3-type subunit 1